jgi:hypothetical protein
MGGGLCGAAIDLGSRVIHRWIDSVRSLTTNTKKRMITNHMTKSGIALAGVALVCSASLQAAALVYEGFEYTSSGFYEPHGQTGSGTGFSAANWNSGTKNGIDVNDSPTSAQSYGSLTVSGLGATSAANLWGNRSRAIDGSLAGAGLLNDGATLWFSVLARNSGGSDKLGFALSDGNFNGSTQWGMDTGVSGIGIFAQNGGAASPAMWTPGALDVSLDSGATIAINGATRLIVGEITWGAALANETLTLYTPDLALNQGAAVAVNSIGDMNQAAFNQISLLVKEGAFIDEIRLGGSYNDVVGIEVVAVPEPSSTALLGLGGLALMFRRRR